MPILEAKPHNKRKNSSLKTLMQTKLDDFLELKQEIEEHLSAINENTAEIQVLFDFLQQLEKKIDHLALRLDTLQSALKDSPHYPALTGKKEYALTALEKQIFLALYTESTPLSFQEIAVKANLPASLIPECISTLIEKGIPLVKSFYNDRLFLTLEPQFKEWQARENVINLSLQSFMENLALPNS